MDHSKIMVTQTQTQFLVRQAAILFAIFCAVYFFELASFPLSIDEEMAAFRTDASGWVAQGRWGAYLFETYILPQPVLPFITPAIFGVGCVIAYLLVMDMIGQTELSLTEYACFVIFCGFPTWFFIVEFYSNIAAVGFAFALMTFAVWLGRRASASHPILYFLGATAAGAVALSIYQGLVPAMLTMGIAVAMLRAQRGSDKSLVGEVMRVGLLLACSLAAYAVVQIIFRAFITLRSAYFDSLVRPELLLQQPLLVLSRTLASVTESIGLDQPGYGVPLWAIPPLLALGVAAILFGPARQRLLMAAAALVALAAPFGINLISGGVVPTRGLIGLPVAIWLFTYLAVGATNSKMRIAGGLMLAVAVFQILVMQASYQASSSLAGKSDMLLAASLHDRLTAAPGFDPKVKYALSTFGSRPYPSIYPKPKSSTVGSSFFEWDGGNAWRIARYMTLLGFSNVTAASVEQVDRSIARLATMPAWPAEGSIEIDGDIALVRLGNAPSFANQQAMERVGVR
jgi:hypothetical protein